MFGFGVKKISAVELADKLAHRKQALIDVREPHEFAAGHVPGAVNVPLGVLAQELGRFDPAEDIYLICRSGGRSTAAAKVMKQAGFENAYNVSGGTLAWRGKLDR